MLWKLPFFSIACTATFLKDLIFLHSEAYSPRQRRTPSNIFDRAFRKISQYFFTVKLFSEKLNFKYLAGSLMGLKKTFHVKMQLSHCNDFAITDAFFTSSRWSSRTFFNIIILLVYFGGKLQIALQN